MVGGLQTRRMVIGDGVGDGWGRADTVVDEAYHDRNCKTKSAAFTDFMDALAKACQDALHFGKPKPPTKPFIDEYNDINGTNINATTVYQHLKYPNTNTKELSAAKHQLLSTAEETTLLAHIHEMAAHALPPNRAYIERAALEIVHS